MKRAVSGLLFVVILTACIFVHPLCFFALFLVINVLGILEFVRLAERLQVRMNRPMCLVSGVLLFAASFLHNYWGYEHGYLFFMAAVLALAIWELYRKDAHAFQNLAFSYYVLAYFTLPFALLVYFPYMCNGTWQPDIIFYPFLLMWLNDTFAYLVGTQFGKHKLFPRISPKKSWEGTIGGGIMSIAAGLFLAPYIDGITVVDAGVIAGIVVVFGNFGDLIESMFKRCIEVKDSGHIMPGHGGMLDRFDSILLALPAIFVYLSFSCGWF